MRNTVLAAPVLILLCVHEEGGALGIVPPGLWVHAAFAQDQSQRREDLQPIIRAGPSGKPLALAIGAEGAGSEASPRALSFIRLTGFPEGVRFSHGFSLRNGSAWFVSANDLPSLQLLPPESFIGALQLYVDFFTQNDPALKPVYAESRWYIVRIGEDAIPPSPVGANPGASQSANRPNAALVEQEPPPGRPDADSQPFIEEAEALLRAEDLLKRRDITAARLLYEDLALNGSAQGALALAKTYDPAFLEAIGAIGMQPDLAQARKWYEKAAQLGEREALKRLSELQ